MSISRGRTSDITSVLKQLISRNSFKCIQNTWNWGVLSLPDRRGANVTPSVSWQVKRGCCWTAQKQQRVTNCFRFICSDWLHQAGFLKALDFKVKLTETVTEFKRKHEQCCMEQQKWTRPKRVLHLEKWKSPRTKSWHWTPAQILILIYSLISYFLI